MIRIAPVYRWLPTLTARRGRNAWATSSSLTAAGSSHTALSTWPWKGDPAQPRLVGELRLASGGRAVALQYDPAWLAAGFPLSEDLPLRPDLYVPREKDTAAGAVDDARPDRWGERVIRKFEKSPRFEVRNTGPTIDQSSLQRFFDSSAARIRTSSTIQMLSWPWALHRPRNCEGQRWPDRGLRGRQRNRLFRAPASRSRQSV